MSEDAFWINIANKNINYFYKGTLSDWNNIQIEDSKNAIHYIRDNDVELEFLEGNNLYFYSEIEPAEKGKYWHFNNNNQPIVWN